MSSPVGNLTISLDDAPELNIKLKQSFIDSLLDKISALWHSFTGKLAEIDWLSFQRKAQAAEVNAKKLVQQVTGSQITPADVIINAVQEVQEAKEQHDPAILDIIAQQQREPSNIRSSIALNPNEEVNDDMDIIESAIAGGRGHKANLNIIAEKLGHRRMGVGDTLKTFAALLKDKM